MRIPILVATVMAVTLTTTPARAGEALAACKDFFAKFEKCADGLTGDQQDEARVYIKTMRGIIGMNDSLNQGDAMVTGMMCNGMMDEMKKDKDVQSYNCKW